MTNKFFFDIVESGCSSWFKCFMFLGVIKMSEVAENTGNTRNTCQKTIKKTNMTDTKKQGNDAKGIKTKEMNVQRRGVDEEEYNELKSINNNSCDISASSRTDSGISTDSSIDNSNIERDPIGSNTNNTVAFNSSPEKNLKFKNKLVAFLYKNYKGKYSIEQALTFFKSNKVLASYFDDNFWDEILYVINLSNCTIKQLVEFKQNVVTLANNQVSLLGNLLGPKMAPEKIKFAISPDMFQNLVYNSGGKIFVGYLDGGERQKYLDSFRIVLDGSNDDMRRESCGKLLNFILKDLENDCQPVKDMIVLLQICRVLLCQKTIPVNVDGWKKIFTKIESLSIKDFLKIRLFVDNPKIKLGDLEKFLFSKLNSKDDTQQEVQRFIAMFFSNNEIKNEIKNDALESRLYIFNLFIGSFPSQKLDFGFVKNFAQQRLGLKLSDLSIERLLKLLSKVKSSSINSNTFKALVEELVKSKNIVLGTRNGVNELRQLLCDVLRISGKELGFSNVMDLFLLCPKMPELCTKSTLTNESLKLALEKINKISAIGSSNGNLNNDKDEFRSKFKKFVGLFKDGKDGSDKITLENFKNLISVVPDDCLDFDCINYLLKKTDTQEHQNDLFSFFENTLLKKEIDNRNATWEKFHEFLLQHKFYNRTLKTDTFRYIINAFVKNATGESVDTLVTKRGEKDKFREQFKMFVSSFISSLQNSKITFDSFKNLILAMPNDCFDFGCINDLLEKTDLLEHKNELCDFFWTILLKKISKYKFDLNQVRGFFDKYSSDKSVKDYKFKAETFGSIVDAIINSNQDRSCNNNDIEWLLQKCCDAGLKLENNKFVNLIKKGEIDKEFADRKIDWLKMNGFINEVILPDKNLFGSGKIELNINSGLQEILSRTKFCFYENNLSDFLKKILALKKFVTGDKLFAIVLNRIPLNGLSNLDMFRKIVYYCFEDVENYNSDRQIPVDCCHKIDFKLYNELLKTFQDDSLSYDDFKALNNDFFGKQESSNFLDFLFGIFRENKTNANVSDIDHTVLRKKLKKGILSSNQIQDLFKKFGKNLSIDQFVELLMLAEDRSLTEDDVISLFNNYCNEEMPLEVNNYKKESSIKDEKSLSEKTEINTNSIDETHNKNEIINIGDNIPSFSNAKNESLISHRTSANPKATVPVNLVKSINIEQKNYFDMVTRKINEMKNVQELKNRLRKSNEKKRWMKLLDDIDDDFSLLFRLNPEELADKYQLFINKYKKNDFNNSNVNSQHLGIKIDVNGNINNLDINLNGVVSNEHEDYMDYKKFKEDFFMLWGKLDKKKQMYIKVIFGHKTRLWPTAVCWCFSYMLFYPGILVCYLLGVAMILFFTFKFIDKMVRRGLVGVAHGEKPFCLIRGNKCIKYALQFKDLKQTCSASKIEKKSLLDAINPAKDKILSVMVPNMESGNLGSFMEELSSLKNGAIRVFNLVKNRVF